MVLEKDRAKDAGSLRMGATEGRGLITHPEGVRVKRRHSGLPLKLPSRLRVNGASRVSRER